MSRKIGHNADSNVNLSNYFPKGVFWDVDISMLDYKRDVDYIIPRVLDKGLLFDCLDSLDELYSLEAIQYFCINSSQIFGNEKIHVLAKRYKLEPEQFIRFDTKIESVYS